MPIKTNDRIGKFAFYEVNGQSHPVDTTLYRETRVYNNIESRAYPQGPVWTTLTGQAQQSTERRSPCVAQRTISPTYWRRELLWGATPHTEITKLNTNWESGIRQEAQELRANLSSAVAEIKETTKMFIDFAKEMRRLRRRLVSGRRRNKPISPCAVSSAQLLVNFGIKPTVQDLFTLFGALQQKVNGEPVFRLVTRSTDSFSENTGTGAFDLHGHGELSERAIFYVKMHTSNLGTIDLGNPAEWAWELIPFSFVVDWAIPVGDYITDLHALAGFSVLGGTVTSKVNYNGAVTPKSSYYYNEVIETGTVNYKSHQRRVYQSIPLPDLPRFDMTRSLGALRNAIALLHQLRKC